MSQLLGKPGVCICCLGTDALLEVFNTNQIHALQEKGVLMKEVSQDAQRKVTRMAKYLEMTKKVGVKEDLEE